jgi:hypothetical protein
LESESRLALAALGLDPGLGVLHMDAPARDSLACDLMEPIRPQVDSYVFDLLQNPLRREWVFEERNGNCRLIAEFVSHLAETSQSWAKAIAPFAELIARILWTTTKSSPNDAPPATRLTLRRKYEARGTEYTATFAPVPRPPNVCSQCGIETARSNKCCLKCKRERAKTEMLDIARAGRLAAHSVQARAKRSFSRRRVIAAQAKWNPAVQPEWLTEELFKNQVVPRLKEITCPVIAQALDVTETYAANIRAGRYLPHPRHWKRLFELGSKTCSAASNA